LYLFVFVGIEVGDKNQYILTGRSVLKKDFYVTHAGQLIPIISGAGLLRKAVVKRLENLKMSEKLT